MQKVFMILSLTFLCVNISYSHIPVQVLNYGAVKTHQSDDKAAIKILRGMLLR